MLRAYLRLALFVAGLVGAVILFAFAFTAGAIVLFVTIVLLALFGRPPTVQWWRMDGNQPRPRQDGHLIIDHDPNDLPDR